MAENILDPSLQRSLDCLDKRAEEKSKSTKSPMFTWELWVPDGNQRNQGWQRFSCITASPMAKLETMAKKKKGKGNEEVNKKYERKKVAPKDLQDIKQKNGKKYHWCIKHQMWTLHTPKDCKLEEKEVVKADNLKLTVALTAIDDDEDSVEWLLVLWFVRIWGSIISRYSAQHYCARLHWINSISHLLI